MLNEGNTAAVRWFTASYWVLFVIAALSLVGGVVAALQGVQFEPPIDSGWLLVLVGLLFGLLAVFVKRRSLLALGIAIALYVIPALIGLLSGYVTGILIKIILAFILVKGFLSLLKLKIEGRERLV
jgi:hypothetical protein